MRLRFDAKRKPMSDLKGDGVILKEGEFVPYDGGPPATTDELQIVVAPRSGLDAVVLQNSRVLVPKN